jgi:hypothetical protein
MRNLFLAIFFITAHTLLNAQSFIENNFKNILNDEKLIRVQLGGKAFNMLHTLGKGSDDEDFKKVVDLVSKIKSFDLIALEKTEKGNELFKAALNNASGFEELIRVKSEKANVNIRIKENNNIVSEVIGIINADSAFAVFDLVGEININDIGELANKVNESNLNKVFKKSNLELGELNVYPNPVVKGQNVKVEVPNSVVGGKAYIYDSTGRKVKEVNLNSSNIELNISDLTSSKYVIKFEKGDTSISRKLIITE